MLHLAKLAVGVRDIGHLRRLQHERGGREPPLRHRTRHAPRRRDDVTDGGSLYWVVAGTMLVRQRIVDIVEDTLEGGSACAALILDPELVATEGRPTRAFQGWRYLAPEAAPPDLPADAPDLDLPPQLATALRRLCLL